ncbi:cation-translocating P-type ATPase [Sneathia sp. DSM 16631]|uniref:heavy metal translocating P-type ATPase n=1 Tax=Sneathia sp. DSM 16631 TaxID=2777994 RepID=UPI001869349E|nr:cation-translocating P-type ATPase [Sneathia sp. DSM 16631]MBE3030936.1 cation-translocating P-type ATPase [Sneathia sp. DSM 16631]
MKIYRIKGMSCSACALKIEEGLEKYGVRAKVNFISEKLVVEDDNNVDIVNIVSKLGYELIKDNDNIEEKEVNLLPIGIIAVIVLILAMFHIQNSEYVQLILSLIVIILSRDILLIGVKSIFKLTFTMYSLISLGVLISFLYSIFNLKNNLIYFDGICMTIFIVLLGKKIEKRLKKNTSKAIENLTNIIPIKENIKIGDVLSLNKGTVASFDGKIIEGYGIFDEKLITGESKQKIKRENDRVYAGCKLIDGSIKYVVDIKKEDMVIYKIKNMLELACEIKSPITNFTDKVTKIFVPTVILIAIVTYILGRSVNNAICVLLISCPCAIGLSIPICLVVTIGSLAKKNILIKDGSAILNATRIDKIVFDKTGTLTKGEPSIKDIDILQEDVDIVYNMEKNLSHPLAKAIKEYLKRKYVVEDKDIKVRNYQGLGVGYSDYLVGSINLLKRKGIDVSEINNKYDDLSKEGKTVILISKYKEIRGLVTLIDDINDNTPLFINYCKENHIDTSILSGDNMYTTRYIADKLGIEKYAFEVLPYNKSRYIENILEKNKVVAMVGDGINDITAINSADIGIAINNGAVPTLETSDVVINDLMDIPVLQEYSKLCLKYIKENLFFTLIYNIFGIMIATGIFGIQLTPMIASMCMILSSISVLLNTLRLKRSCNR